MAISTIRSCVPKPVVSTSTTTGFGLFAKMLWKSDMLERRILAAAYRLVPSVSFSSAIASRLATSASYCSSLR